MLPTREETLPALRKRYQVALERVWETTDEAAVLEGRRPGMERTYVFDEGGIRLIVSRDRQPDGSVVLHVSASPYGEIYKRIERGFIAFDAFDVMVRSQFRNISGDQRRLKFSQLSEGKGVPHYWLEDPKELA